MDIHQEEERSGEWGRSGELGGWCPRTSGELSVKGSESLRVSRYADADNGLFKVGEHFKLRFTSL